MVGVVMKMVACVAGVNGEDVGAAAKAAKKWTQISHFYLLSSLFQAFR